MDNLGIVQFNILKKKMLGKRFNEFLKFIDYMKVISDGAVSDIYIPPEKIYTI